MTVVVAPLSGSKKLCLREVFTSTWASRLLPGYIRTYVSVRELVMENRLLDKVENNAVVQAWSENRQLEKGDSLAEGYVSELWDFTRISVTQNELQELRDIWAHWDDETKKSFYHNYGDLPYLLDIKVDKGLFRAMTQFWNPAYSCFTFGRVDLVPTVEEYAALLRCLKFQINRAYVKATNAQSFVKKLMNITRMSEQWVTARIQQKDAKKSVDVFALSIYGLMIFPKALRHVDEAVTDLFDRLAKPVMPIPTILAETFRSLSACRRAREGRFVGCAQLLLVWLHGHFWKVLYRCEDFDWIPLLGIWGAIGYAPLLVLRQYELEQFIPKLTGRPMTTPEYSGWLSKRINDNIPRLSLDGVQSMEECLRVIPSKLEIIKQDFERKNSELGKKIEQLEEEKTYLRLDVDVQKLEAEKLRKGKRKAKEDLDHLKTDYKQLHKSMRNAGLGKTSEQWQQEIQDARARESVLKKSLVESQNEKEILRAQVEELEMALYQSRSCNSTVELKASLNKIEDLREKIEELETVLQNRELQIQLLESNNEQWKEQLHRYQNQVRDRDHIMGEAMAQIREVTEHLQTLAVQADVLSVKYELESDRGRELARLFEKVKALSIRARQYI
ncbi:hypothetical protein J1N35_015587 [Gossypium stocksii]|uniref:DUF7745 domain-containing protein n=1 Tax=Gossypium stocksii TaxID=47602 RepID=A0A9D3VYX4_9ROSI|nr:hypothetical protein J1N35_015587 [Gossypium stocksii]